MSSIRVFLLDALAEGGPMHGHQLRLLAEKEHVHLWTDFGVGAIYGALKRLTADGLIDQVRTEREGARPERQVLEITAAGLASLDVMRRQTLSSFELKPDPFDLALARPGPLLQGELPATLEHRRSVIATRLAAHRETMERVTPVLTLAERHVMRHQGYRLEAELAWLDAVLADLPAILADESTRENP